MIDRVGGVLATAEGLIEIKAMMERWRCVVRINMRGGLGRDKNLVNERVKIWNIMHRRSESQIHGEIVMKIGKSSS